MSILVPDGDNNLSSIVGTYKIFSRANQFFQQKGKKLPFKIELIGHSRRVDFHSGLFRVKPHRLVHQIEKTDLIIIPSLNHNFKQGVRVNRGMIEWIRDQYKQGAEVASICTGAFLLASTGLLNGRHCSTHWSAAEAFREQFPEVQLLPDQLITDEHGLYTNGGAFSFLNLIVYLIEKHYSREAAIYCAKVFQIEIDRSSQSAFAIFNGQKGHGDDAVKKAQEYIEHHVDERISVEDLCDKLALSRRNFDRRFIKATGNSPLEYTQRVKIEAAKKAFENSRKPVNEVMLEVGYSDTKAFREVFKKITGLSPLDYRKKYNKDAEVLV